MTIRLHKFIEQAETLGVPNPHGSPISPVMCVTLLRHARNAVCFDCGDSSDIVGMRCVEELATLPFDVCWFEWMQQSTLGTSAPMAVLVTKHPKLQAAFIRMATDGSGVFCCCAVGQSENGKWTGVWNCKADEPFNEEFQRALDFVSAFLTALNCSNVERRLNEPPMALQKARARRGKPPLFSYWTLHLRAKQEDGSAMGGTHASPRLHLRRGHPRQFSPGKWTWVQPCVVGNKALGIVHKDYAATPSLYRAAEHLEIAH